MSTKSKLGLVAVALMLGACSSSHPRAANEPAPRTAQAEPWTPPPPDPSFDPQTSGMPLNDPRPGQATLEAPPMTSLTDPGEPKPFSGEQGVPAPGEAEAKVEPPLQDGQILAVILAANDGEVQAAELARRNAVGDEVKQFAATMLSHHTQALGKARVVQTKARLQAEETDTSTKLKSDAATLVADLRTKKGREFDRAYVDSQVKAHREVLALLDDRVLPGAQNVELKAQAAELRRTVADHLIKAEALQQKLSEGESPAAAD